MSKLLKSFPGTKPVLKNEGSFLLLLKETARAFDRTRAHSWLVTNCATPPC